MGTYRPRQPFWSVEPSEPISAANSVAILFDSACAADRGRTITVKSSIRPSEFRWRMSQPWMVTSSMRASKNRT